MNDIIAGINVQDSLGLNHKGSAECRPTSRTLAYLDGNNNVCSVCKGKGKYWNVTYHKWTECGCCSGCEQK